MNVKRNRIGWCLMAAAALAMFVGCALLGDGPVPTGEKGFVGRISGRDALVGVLVEGDEVLAYVCDAVEGRSSISAWFEGSLNGDRMVLEPVAGTTYETTSLESALSGVVRDGEIRGTMTLADGTELPWTAEPARGNTPGGIYVEGDDVELTSVVVDNSARVRGLSRSRRTGWTSRVTPTGLLFPTTRLPVRFTADNGRQTTRQLPIRQRIPILRPIVKPRPDPLPDSGGGTLMIQLAVAGGRVTGHQRLEQRADPIGVPTMKRSGIFQNPDRARRIPSGLMRVRVLDESGKVLSGQIIDDPMHEFLEVPDGERGDGGYWVRSNQSVESFLVAVPNFKEGRRVQFTRFSPSGFAIHTGLLDLKADPVKKTNRTAQVNAVYDLTETEYNTVVNNGPPEQRFDLLILAEGYQDSNAHRDAFNEAVSNMLVNMWSFPIYAEFQSVINVHTAYLPSVDAGASTQGGDAPEDRNTVYQSFFDCNVEQCRLLRLTPDGTSRAQLVAFLADGNYGLGSIDAILVLVNSTIRGGGGGTLVTMSAHPDAWSIAAHELGHTVVGLADEYETEYGDDQAINEQAIAGALTKPNVSGPVVNPTDLKWFDLVHPNTAIPTQEANAACIRSAGCTASTLPDGTVGMYEGAGYTACDSYRPTTRCRMRCDVLEFCPVCRKEFRDTFTPFVNIPPAPDPEPNQDPDLDPANETVDIYMRDNSLDVGNVPSPHNVPDPSSGSSAFVKAWNSVDIRVDAPPFDESGEAAHENPIAGVENRVTVTVHNRGTLAGSAPTQVLLYFANATGGAPPFPNQWTAIGGGLQTQVPGQGGEGRVVFNWIAGADLTAHTCMVATASTEGDEAPPPGEGLGAYSRNSNNVTWKNLHVVRTPEIEGEITNYERAAVPIILRIEAPEVPVGTVFDFNYQTNISLSEFIDGDPRQMEVGVAQDGRFTFTRTDAVQQFFTMRADLPQGDPNDPFVSTFLLKVILPGGTPIGETYQISIEQLSFDPATGFYGDPIGGNTYFVGFE